MTDLEELIICKIELCFAIYLLILTVIQIGVVLI